MTLNIQPIFDITCELQSNAIIICKIYWMHRIIYDQNVVFSKFKIITKEQEWKYSKVIRFVILKCCLLLWLMIASNEQYRDNRSQHGVVDSWLWSQRIWTKIPLFVNKSQPLYYWSHIKADINQYHIYKCFLDWVDFNIWRHCSWSSNVHTNVDSL